VLLFAALFPGGGPQKDGLDPHWEEGRDMVYPGGMLAYHLKPWRAAIGYGLHKVVPYYGICRAVDDLGAAYSKKTMGGLLKERLGFEGWIGSDYDVDQRGWGLPEGQDRLEALFTAGTHQLNENESVKDREPRVRDLVMRVRELVRAGRIPMAHVDEAAALMLLAKFRLGLFDNPFTDPKWAARVWGGEEGTRVLAEIYERSAILLKNDGVLPLKPGCTVAMPLGHPSRQAVREAGLKVVPLQHWQSADVVMVEIEPFEPVPDCRQRTRLDTLQWRKWLPFLEDAAAEHRVARESAGGRAVRPARSSVAVRVRHERRRAEPAGARVSQ